MTESDGEMIKGKLRSETGGDGLDSGPAREKGDKEDDEEEGQDGNGEAECTGAGEVDGVGAVERLVRCTEVRRWAVAIYLVKIPRVESEGEGWVIMAAAGVQVATAVRAAATKLVISLGDV